MKSNCFNLQQARWASRSELKRTTPVPFARISAKRTSPTSQNLSRKSCQVQLTGNCVTNHQSINCETLNELV